MPLHNVVQVFGSCLRIRFAARLALGTMAMLPAWASAEPILGLTLGNQLIAFDSATPGTTSAPVAIAGLQAGEQLLGIDRRPATGQVTGVSSANRMYVIDPVTGSATQVGSDGAFSFTATDLGVDFNPVVDRLRITTSSDQNLRLNPITGGLAGTDAALAYAAGDPNVGANPRVVGSGYTNNFAGTSVTTLFNIDSALNILVTQNPPNNGVLNTVGALGFDVLDTIGFDISGLSGIAYLTSMSATGGFSSLYTVNLATGAASLVGTIGGQVPLRGLAAPVGTPVPEPGSLTLLALGLGGVVGRRRLRK